MPGTAQAPLDRATRERGTGDDGTRNRTEGGPPPTGTRPVGAGREMRAELQHRVLQRLIEIVRRFPQDGEPRRAPVRDLFRSVPAEHAKGLRDRLDPGAPTDDFAQYLKQQFPITRGEALAVLSTAILGGALEAAPALSHGGPETPLAEVRDNAKYIERAFHVMGMPIPGGAFYYSPDPAFSPFSPNNIILPRSMVCYGGDPLAGANVVFLGRVHDTESAAANEAARLALETGMRVIGYYRGPGGYIFPTIISATTAPAITAVARTGIDKEAEFAAAGKKTGWELFWWYVAVRFPFKAKTPKPPTTSLVELAMGKAAYAEHLKVVLELRKTVPALARLSVDELIAIRAYTAEWSQAMNWALRGVHGSPNAETLIAAATSGLRKLPPVSGRFVRTFPMAIDEAMAMYRQGATVVESAFTSATQGSGLLQKKGTMSVIIKAIGRNGKDVSMIAQHAEKEVLFLPGTKFFVEEAARYQDALVMVWQEL